MYAGHVGVALGAKGIRQSLPLWTLIIASQLPDWTDATLCLAGVRSGTPGLFSHSFPAIGVLVFGATLVYLATSRDLTGSAFIGAIVVSHALGDYITGLKPTWAGGPMIGLQMYKHPAVDFLIEAVVIIAGWWIYRSSFPRERQSSGSMFSVLGVLLALQLLADIVFSVSPGIKKC